MLAPISWPVPPPGYGPWEQVAFDIADGMRRRGLDVTLFAPANSRFDGRAGVGRPGRHQRGSGTQRRGLYGTAHRRTLPARGRVRLDPQQLRLEADDLRARLRVSADAYDDPRLFVAANSGGVLRLRRPLVLLFDFRFRSRSRTRLSRDGLQRHRSEPIYLQRSRRRLSRVPRPLSSRERRASRDRNRETRGRAVENGRDPAGRGVLPRVGRAAHRRRSACSSWAKCGATRATSC